MDFKYIIIRASSALLLLSGPLFTACDDDDPDAFITVSKQEIEVEYNGLTANGETVNFDLGSNHAWQATYVEEWIHPTHTEGDRGRTRTLRSTKTTRAKTAKAMSYSRAAVRGERSLSPRNSKSTP